MSFNDLRLKRNSGLDFRSTKDRNRTGATLQSLIRREKVLRALNRLFDMSGIAVGLACALLLVPSFSHAAAVCTLPGTGLGWQVVTVHSDGLNRKVPLYIPASAAGRSDIPLVF